MLDFLGINSLFAEMIAGVGLALVVGNAAAFVRHRRGHDPEDAPGPFRAGRSVFLMVVGALMATWGIASFLTRPA